MKSFTAFCTFFIIFYYCRLQAQTAPSVTVSGAASVTSNSTILSGFVNDNGATTTVRFVYGTQPDLSSNTITAVPGTGSTISIGSGLSATNVNLSGLNAGATYYYRIKAWNNADTVTSSIMSFTTVAVPSLQPVLQATNIGPVSAKISFTNGNGSKRVIFIRRFNISGTPPLINNSVYSANSILGQGTQAGDWYCIYNGTGNQVIVTGLAQGVTYRVMGMEYNENSQGGGQTYNTATTTSNIASFIADSKPTASTQSAISPVKLGATLRAIVNPWGDSTSVYFEYASSSSFESFTTISASPPVIEPATTSTNVTALLSVLSPGTYYFRVKAMNSIGTTTGNVLSVAIADSPLATTSAATAVTATTARLNGAVNAKGGVTETEFIYGKHPSLAFDTKNTRASGPGGYIEQGSEEKSAYLDLTGLSPATNYYFRIKAVNSLGLGTGSILNFLTPSAAPGITLDAHTSLSSSGVVLNAAVNPNGEQTTVSFVYGKDPDLLLGTSTLTATTGAALTAENFNVPVTLKLSSLTGGTTYYYKVVAVNSVGSTNSVISKFTTEFVGSQSEIHYGSKPRDIEIADIDGDGKPDVVTADDTSVSILQNTSSLGAASFNNPVNLSSGLRPSAVAVADIDGDNIVDIISANKGSNSISVFRNLRIGSTITASTLAEKIDFATGTEPYSITPGDIDGDGKTDLIIQNTYSAHISVLRNTSSAGNISFASKIDFSMNFTAGRTRISLNDMDGDGKADLLASNQYETVASVYRSTSTGGLISFDSKRDFTVRDPVYISSADLDNDGKPDMITASQSGYLSILRNTSSTGNVTFEEKKDFYVPTPGTPWQVGFGHMDGDDKVDILAMNSTGAGWTINLLRNKSSSGIIDLEPSVQKAPRHDSSESLRIADIDGDGMNDIILPTATPIVGNFSSGISVFLNTDPVVYLSGLTLNNATLEPVFNSATQIYTASVAYHVTAVTVRPTLSDPSSVVKVNGVSLASGTNSASIPLSVGNNTITVSVTSGNGLRTKPYTINVSRAAHIPASLAFLTPSEGVLSPVFDPGTTSYTSSVGNSISSLTFTPALQNAIDTIQIRVNGGNYVNVANNSASSNLSLNVGSNTVDVKVTTQNSTAVKTYTVNLIRRGLPTITSFAPASGPVGSLITINGTNLDSVLTATVGGTNAIVVSKAGTRLVAMVMPNTLTGGVSVTTLDGSATATGNFSIEAARTPNTQQGSKLVATDNAGTASQGSSLAVSADGNTAIVGGPFDNSSEGAIWIFKREGNTWTQQGSKLVGTGNIGAARQGSSVAISADGNTVIVGGGFDDSERGAVWVYTRTGTTWTQQGAKLVGTGSIGKTRQGSSVSLSADGNTAIIGGHCDDNFQGAAWVFIRKGGIWRQLGDKLKARESIGAAQQGSSVALSADGNSMLMAGNADNSNRGAVWVFTRNGNTWNQTIKLVSPDNNGQAWFGSSVSLNANGKTAIIGNMNDAGDKGAVWIFNLTNNIWSPQGSKLVGTGATAARQGVSVSVNAGGDVAIVGGYGDNANRGASWVYARDGNAWFQEGSKLVGTGGSDAAFQGNSVALSADGTIALVSGHNDNSGQGATWIYYHISKDANLSSLSLSSGTLSPVFSPIKTEYAAAVDNSVSSVAIIPVRRDTRSKVKVRVNQNNYIVVSSGPMEVPLNVGANTINVLVTAEDTTQTKTYTVTITRAASTIATLSSLSLTNATLTPGFIPDSTSYRVTVPNATTSVKVTPRITESTATVKVNGAAVVSDAASGDIPLAVGSNLITTIVTAGDGSTTKTYTITVTRAASAIANLSALTMSTGTLSPAFVSGTTSYTASVANTVTGITLTPTIEHAGSSVKVNGTAVASGSASGSISLNVGSNNLTVLVTAEDGSTTKTYAITVIRAASDQAVTDQNGNVTVSASAPEVLVSSPSLPIAITVPASVTNPAIDYGALISGGTGTLPQTTVTSPVAGMAIPASTSVTGSSSWDGVIAAPTVSTYELPPVSGEITTTGLVIEVGSTSGSLFFNKAVRLLLPGQAGMRAGFVRGGVFTEITTTGAADSQTAGDALPPGGAFKISSGADLVIWTKGFSRFITFTRSVDPNVAMVASDKDALTDELIRGTNTDLANVVSALANPLPAAGTVSGSVITWSSDKPDVISNDGKAVVRPVTGGDIMVTLTATIKKGQITDTKKFTIVVRAIPAPVINSFTPESAKSGASVQITGTDFSSANAVSFGGTTAASFTVNSPTSITAVVAEGTSGPVTVTTPSGTGQRNGFTFIYTLPVSNFRILATGESCKTSNDGSIKITAVKNLNYTALITGTNTSKSVSFTTEGEVKDLPAGTYNICITVDGRTDYKQCYEVVITEPKDLAVYVAVNKSDNLIDLSLDGGTIYHIELNGKKYATTQGNITLSLLEGDNSLKITTDKECQGMVLKNIYVRSGIRPFPNPFIDVLNLDLGNKMVARTEVQLHNLAGRLVYSKIFINQSGVVSISVPELESGLYLLKLSADDSESISKVFKK